MKTKNFGLAAFAFIIAIGAASATMFTSRQIYVKAHPKSDPLAQACMDTGAACDDSGANPCVVTISVTGGTQVIQTNTSFRPYQLGCSTQVLKSTSSTSISGTASNIDSVIAE